MRRWAAALPRARVVALALAGLVVLGAGAGSFAAGAVALWGRADRVAPVAVAVPASAPVPVPVPGPADEHAARVHPAAALDAAATWSGTADYLLVGADSAPRARVRVVRAVDRVRVDVVRDGGPAGSSTSSLIPTASGWVACSTEPAQDPPTWCVQASAAGAAAPPALDPGIAPLLTAQLADLARRLRADDGVTVVGSLSATDAVPAATCLVAGAGPRTCVGADGLLRTVETGTGVLRLVSSSRVVPGDAFTPPATPVPLG